MTKVDVVAVTKGRDTGIWRVLVKGIHTMTRLRVILIDKTRVDEVI